MPRMSLFEITNEFYLALLCWHLSCDVRIFPDMPRIFCFKVSDAVFENSVTTMRPANTACTSSISGFDIAAIFGRCLG